MSTENIIPKVYTKFVSADKEKIKEHMKNTLWGDIWFISADSNSPDNFWSNDPDPKFQKIYLNMDNDTKFQEIMDNEEKELNDVIHNLNRLWITSLIDKLIDDLNNNFTIYFRWEAGTSEVYQKVPETDTVVMTMICV